MVPMYEMCGQHLVNQMSRQPPSTLTYREAAHRIGCHYETLRTWVRNGAFTAIRPYGEGHGRPGYIPIGEVDAFMQGGFEAVEQLKGDSRPRKARVVRK